MPFPVDTSYANGSPAIAEHSLQYAPIVTALTDNTAFFRMDTGTAINSYRVDFSTGNVVGAYSDGMVVYFRVRGGGANTGPATFTITGPSGDLPGVPLKRSGGGDLSSGDLRDLQIVAAVYNAPQSYFELLGGVSSDSSLAIWFGDGSDGDVTLSSGTLTLTRDMYWRNLTITGSAVVRLEGFRGFVQQTLDLSNAGAGAIRANGSNATGATGGAGRPANTVGGSTSGSNGAPATSGVGQPAGAAVGVDPGDGGNGGGTRASGGGANAGAAVAAGVTTAHPTDLRYPTLSLLRGASLIGGGAGGRGGSSGGGDGTNLGGVGGGGGGGGSVLALYAQTIITSATTAAGVIRSVGGTGDPATSPGAGNCGGGSGGAGGGGGYIYLVFQNRVGPAIANGLRSHGGDGGSGAAGTGTGLAGGGGDGGGAGSILQYNVSNNAVVLSTGNRNSAAGGDAVGNTPGTGGNGRNNQATL